MMTLTKTIDQATILTGDRSKLKDLLASRLAECGWRDEVRLMCRNTIKEKGTNIKVEQLIADITPKARTLVPDTVKMELLMKIKTILAKQEGIDL
ncbi:enhancer of yellow 2 transcription factor-like [Teleopsis dalmanni]|uniref:enhancer of yellow 2 transcription factor-like n=1 Tax=Teleopsis dalmanni TaxID=139649 RepID=UPI0018CDE679|nr:enhancer of yellow 2 transcription factor-like [Teleopsis dalmanni]XP_037952729.1 enhancer of yellow 2 transcription factor-like [Teleopsis dalmanni]